MHHIWMHAGFTPGETTLLLMALNTALGAIGFAAWRLGLPEWVLASAYVGLFMLHSIIATHAWKVSKWLKRQKGA